MLLEPGGEGEQGPLWAGVGRSSVVQARRLGTWEAVWAGALVAGLD